MVITARETKVKLGYKQTEVGVIPEDWEATPLAALAVIQHGYGFQSQYFKSFGKYRLTTPGHFHETGGFREVGEKQKFYDGPFPEGYLLSEGDLIVAMTEQTDGLLGSAAIVPVNNTYLHNQRLGKIKVLSPNLSIRFLYRIFNSNNYRAKVRETAAGTKVKHTSPSKLLAIPIPLPSTKAEQEAISTVFSDVDALLTALDKLIAKKRDIKQTTMKQLLTGKRRLPGFGGVLKLGYKQTEIGTIPSDWKPAPLGLLSAFITKGATPTTYGFDWVNDGILFLRSECVSERGLDLAQSMFITPEAHSVLKRSEVRARDILITITGNVGRVVYLNNGFGSANINQHIARIRINDSNVAADYVFYFLSQPTVRKYYNSITTGQAYPQISLKQVRDTTIFLPPNKAEQQAIANVLSDMDAEIVALERKREKVCALKQGMMQELLTGRIRLL